MNKELGSLLKQAFLSRKPGETSPVKGPVKLKPGERRNVAVLFLDLAGFTAFSEALDHETVHDITGSLMDELVYTAEQYSGYVDKIEGDRIMVLFGAINSVENNSRSAIFCGFKMLEVVELASSVLSDTGVVLSARVGINSGPVTVAPDAIGHLTAMGSTVNIASRIEEVAAKNSILVTDKVYSLCAEDILWESSQRISIRGIGFPILSWKPVAVNYRGNRIPCHESVRTVFVPRKIEYPFLVKAGETQLQRTSGINRLGSPLHVIVELTGEAGTGKTRLVNEFLKNEYSSTDSTILRGNSISEAQPAYWLWSMVLQNLLNLPIQGEITYDQFSDLLSARFPGHKFTGSAPFLGRLVSAISNDMRLQELDNKAIATETKMAIRDVIEALSEMKPLVLMLEDLHWIDSTDSDVLEFLIKNCNSVYPVFFLLTRRSDHLSLLSSNISTGNLYAVYNPIKLGEFNKEETALFTEQFLNKLTSVVAEEREKSNSISSKAIEFIHRHSSGNPFFLQELILHLVESGGISLRNSSWCITDSSVELSTPDSLIGLLQSRLDRLPDRWRKVLLHCSVLGMEFRMDIYKRVESKLGLSPCEEEVFQGLTDRQFLELSSSEDHTSYRFHHSFIQDTAYRSILSHNLKLLHKAAAESMEDVHGTDKERVAGKLADHWERSGEEQKNSAVKWGMIAQKHASKNYQYETVLRWGHKIENWITPCDENLECFHILLKALNRNVNALQYLHRWEELNTLLEKMLEISSDNRLPEWVARTEIAMGSYFREIRDLDEALVHLNRSLDLSRSNGFKEIEGDALRFLGVIAAMKRSFPQARELFEQARDIYSNLNDQRGKAKALGNLGILHRNTGETDQAIPIMEEILEIFQDMGDVRSEAVTLGNLGSMYHDEQFFQKAEEHFGRAIDIFHRLGERMPEGIFLCNLGNVYQGQRNFEDARQSYFQAREIMEEVGDRRTEAWIMTNLGLLYIQEGSPAESEEIYKNAVDVFADIGDEENTAIALAGYGYVQHLTKKHDMALETFAEAFEIISKLKLSAGDFQDTFIKLRRGLIQTQSSETALPWPDHWDAEEQ